MSDLVPQSPSKTVKKRSERGTFLPGNPGGPGHPRGMKNRSTLIQEAKEQLCLDLFQAQPYKRFFKKWFRNFSIRKPKEALELLFWILEKIETKKSGTRVHTSVKDLAALINTASKRAAKTRSEEEGGSG